MKNVFMRMIELGKLLSHPSHDSALHHLRVHILPQPLRRLSKKWFRRIAQDLDAQSVEVEVDHPRLLVHMRTNNFEVEIVPKRKRYFLIHSHHID